MRGVGGQLSLREVLVLKFLNTVIVVRSQHGPEPRVRGNIWLSNDDIRGYIDSLAK